MSKPIALGILCAMVLSTAVAGSVASSESARLHPGLRALLAASDATQMTQAVESIGLERGSGFHLEISPTGQPRIGVLAKVAGPANSVAAIGASWRAGDIVALAVNLSELRMLATDPAILYVEPSWRTEPKLDRSLDVVRADDVHEGSPAYFGDDVVIGIVDTGIDYSHLDFRVDMNGDGFEETSRIEWLYDQTRGFLGAEYTRSEIESDIDMGLGASQGSVRSIDLDGHGTHVASIAAGDGSSSSYGFVGVAPRATLVVVKTTFFTSDILAAVDYIFDRADALGLPAVVNLSLGGHEGPHDGTSLFEEGLDQLASGPGRAIVVSAGNEGNLQIHKSATLSGSTSSFVAVAEDWEMEVGLWYPGDAQFTITVEAPSGQILTTPAGGQSGYVMTADGTVYVDNASGGPNPGNGDREVFIRLASVSSGDRWRIGVTDAGGGGTYDAWVTSSAGTLEGGDSSSTIDEPGNAHRVITVGAFNSKNTWPSLSGDQDFSGEYPRDALSKFSSHGPTRDGRTKPDVAAPGAWICAAGSSSAPTFQYLTHPDGVHVMEIGTSMAAPHVSGAIALLFDIDPTLTGEEIRGILTEQASTDGATGAIPNMSWGWGKLNVAAAVEIVEATGPTEPPVTTERPEVSLAANPVSRDAEFLFEVPADTRTATLRVYTISGRLAFETTVSTSSGEYEWNLRSSRGETLATGLYLYVLVTDRGTSEVGRLVIAR